MSLTGSIGRISPRTAACHGISDACTPSFQGKTLKEGIMLRNSIAVCVMALSMAGPAAAQVALNKNDHITESLVAAQVGDILRKSCGSLSARYFVVYRKMGELEDYARAEGYTEAVVKIFLKDKTEKARIKNLATAYLTKAGAVAGNEESFCQVGRDEIAQKTLVGSLLSSWK
jgi:hypothetical protein